MTTYEPCVLGADGRCTRWSHTHTPDGCPPEPDIGRPTEEEWAEWVRNGCRRADLAALIDREREAAKAEQHYHDAEQFDRYADQHGLCLAGGMRISDCATGPCDCGWEGLPEQLEHARADGMAAAAEPVLALTDVFTEHIRAAIPTDATEALARVRAEAKAEALEEVAHRWTRGEWSDVLLPESMAVIDYAIRMGDWLRDHAARVARETQQDGGDRG